MIRGNFALVRLVAANLHFIIDCCGHNAGQRLSLLCESSDNVSAFGGRERTQFFGTGNNSF